MRATASSTLGRPRTARLLAIVPLVMILPACTPTPAPTVSTSTSTPTLVATAGAYALEVGDCFTMTSGDGPPTAPAHEDCAALHRAEIFFRFESASGEFPGDDALQAAARNRCEVEFTDYVGIAYLESELDYTYLYPALDTWAAGDRETLCVLSDPAGPISTSLRSSRR